MASRARKDRGMRTQLVVAQWFAARGWPFAESTGAARQGADITGTPDIAVEVKARSGFEPLSWIRQAVSAAGGRLPFVVFRCNGQGETSVADWPCLIRLGDLTALLTEAGYGDGGEDAPTRPAMAPVSDVEPSPVPEDGSDPQRPTDGALGTVALQAVMTEAIGRGLSGPERQAVADLAAMLGESGALSVIGEGRAAWGGDERGWLGAFDVVSDADAEAVRVALWLMLGAEYAGEGRA